MRICKHDIISDTQFGEGTPFSCLLSIFKYRMQIAFQINLLHVPFSIAFIRRYTEMD